MLTPEQIATLKHFSPAIDTKIDWDKATFRLLHALDGTREDIQESLEVTSHYRTPDHSAEVGGFPTDEHTEDPCECVDVSMVRSDGKWNSQKAYKVIEAAMNNGFTRIGLNFKNKSMHLGMSNNFPQYVLFIE